MLRSSVPLSETDIERVRAYEIPRRLAGSQALDDDEEVRSIASPVTLEQLVFRFVTELLPCHPYGRPLDHLGGRRRTRQHDEKHPVHCSLPSKVCVSYPSQLNRCLGVILARRHSEGERIRC